MNGNYDKKVEAFEQKLKPLLTDDFLNILLEAVKVCGWTVDHMENSSFVEWCFELAEKDRPNIKPYNYDT